MPVSPVPVGKGKGRTVQSWKVISKQGPRTLNRTKHCSGKTPTHTLYHKQMCSEMQRVYRTVYSYHSVQRQRSPLALGFAGY